MSRSSLLRRFLRRYVARRLRAAPKRGGSSLLPGVLLPLGLAAALLGLALAAWYASWSAGLPPSLSLLRWMDPAHGLAFFPTRLEDRYGQPLGTMLPEPARQARYLPWSHLDPLLQDALTVVMTRDFWPAEPPPDPAADLVRTFLLPDDPPGHSHDLRVGLLAWDLRRRFPETRLWAWWLNTRAFGPGLYGIDAVAWSLFGHSAQRVTVSEAAFLAVAARWPAALREPTADWVEARRKALLRFLYAQGRLTQEELAQALTPPSLREGPPLHPDPLVAWWMTQWEVHGPQPLPARGRVVRMTIDQPLQSRVQCVVEEAFMPARGPCPPEPPWPLAPLPQAVQVEAVVLDPTTGDVLAQTLAAGQSAPQARPLGTALAPWLYAAAFSRGWSPATLVWDIPAAAGPAWTGAVNHDGRAHGPVQAGQALAHTWEVPLALAVEQVGLPAVQSLVQGMGMPLPATRRGPTLWEAPHMTLPDLAHRLAVFALLGRWVGRPRPDGTLGPVWFAESRFLDGTVQPLPPRETQFRLSPALAYLVTYALSRTEWRDTALAQADVPESMAVYVGRAAMGRVLWVLGYSSQRVVGLVLDAREASLPSEDLVRVAAELWSRLARLAHAGRRVPSWSPPEDVVFVPVCVPSGLLPTADCPQVLSMPFLSGQEPHQADTYYRRVPVNARTGRLATVFTSVEDVEERVYFVAPPEARAWAEANGFPQPPTEYDALAASPPDPYAYITAPEPFAYVSGQVQVRGVASGPDFRRYRVQVGRGLFPRGWQTLAEAETPVQNGVLAEWDTTQAEPGLYVLQLQVVDAQGRLRTHSIQVTVDTRPPDIRVLAPQDGEAVTLWQGRFLYVHGEVREDMALARVRILVDGREVVQTEQNPVRLLLPLSPGTHTLTFIVQDRAGNTARRTVQVRAIP